MDGGAWKAAVHEVAEGRTRLSDFTFTFYFHVLEKEMAAHSSVLAWRIPGTASLVGCIVQSMGSHRVGHDWSNLAAAAAAAAVTSDTEHLIMGLFVWFWVVQIFYIFSFLFSLLFLSSSLRYTVRFFIWNIILLKIEVCNYKFASEHCFCFP